MTCLLTNLIFYVGFSIGPVFGYQDYFHGLGIIMDTYSNHNGPHNVSIDY